MKYTSKITLYFETMKTFIHVIKTGFAILLVAMCAFCSLSGLAQNWTGSVNSDWNNSANWSAWPLSNATITINPVNYTGNAFEPVVSSASTFIPDKISVVNGASLTVQANLVTTSDLLINTGGVLIQTAGSVYVGQNLTIANGKTSEASTYEMSGGQLNVYEDVLLKSTIGNYSPLLEVNSGTVTVEGDVTWDGQSPGTGMPRLMINGGTIDLKGNVTNTASGTVKMFMCINSGTVNCSGDMVKTTTPQDSIKQRHPGVIMFSDTTTIDMSGNFYAGNLAQTYFNGKTILEGTGEYMFHTLKINAGKVLDFVTPTHIDLNGDFINNGNFIGHLNSVIFNGTDPQYIGGTSTSTFATLVSNNTSTPGLTLNHDLVVSEAMALFSGKLNTSSSALLTFLDGSTASPGNSTSFVNGPVRKIGNDVFDFPIGKNNTWARLSISAPDSVNSEFTAEYFDTPYSVSSVNTPLNSISNLEYWKLTRTNSTDSIKVSIYWQDASASNINDCAQLTMANYNGSSWDNITSSSTGLCTGTGSGLITSDHVQGNFTMFTFGFLGTSTGISKSDKEPGVKVYPNPGNGNTTLIIPDHLNNVSYKLVDVTGKTILEGKDVSGNINLNYSSQASGVYYLAVKQGETMISWLKLVKV